MTEFPFVLTAHEQQHLPAKVLRSQADDDLARLRDFEAAAERCFSLPRQGALI